MSPIQKNYEGKGVALSDDNRTVFGSGDTAKEAAQDAHEKGHSEATLLYVQPSNLLYCG